MANVSQAMLAKSDQLNYDDIGNGELIITITEVRVANTEQPVSIFYQGCNNKPYKPCKSMIRLISTAWGDESDYWVGKSIKLYGDETVRWGGKEIGGIRIKAFSDIDKNGISAFVTISRGKRRKVKIDCFEVVSNVQKYQCPKCGQPEFTYNAEKNMYVCGVKECKHEQPPKQQ